MTFVIFVRDGNKFNNNFVSMKLRFNYYFFEFLIRFYFRFYDFANLRY